MLPPLRNHDHVDYDKAAPRSNRDSGNALAATEQSGGNRREEAMVGVACRPPVRANPKRWFVQFPLHTSNDAQEAH
jgi:hypothetical protein